MNTVITIKSQTNTVAVDLANVDIMEWKHNHSMLFIYMKGRDVPYQLRLTDELANQMIHAWASLSDPSTQQLAQAFLDAVSTKSDEEPS